MVRIDQRMAYILLKPLVFECSGVRLRNLNSCAANELEPAVGLAVFGGAELVIGDAGGDEEVMDVGGGGQVGELGGGLVPEFGLEAGEVVAAEGGADEGLDEDGAGAGEGLLVVVAFCLVGGVGCGVEGFGIDAELGGVAGGAGFAGGCGGAFGFLAVAAGGGALLVGGPAAGLAGWGCGHESDLGNWRLVWSAGVRPGITLAGAGVGVSAALVKWFRISVRILKIVVNVPYLLGLIAVEKEECGDPEAPIEHRHAGFKGPSQRTGRDDFEKLARCNNLGANPSWGEISYVASDEVGRTTGLSTFQEDIVVRVGTGSNRVCGLHPIRLRPDRVQSREDCFFRPAKPRPAKHLFVFSENAAADTHLDGIAER